eukprot:403338738
MLFQLGSSPVETGYFTIRSYEKDSSTSLYKFVENSDVTLTVTPQPGTLSDVTLTPQVSVVGETTTVLMSLTLQHDFPVDGKLKIIMPKWNPFASSQSLMLSYITVSTSPGYVNCNPVLNFQSQKLQCLFTQGTSTDTLEIQMASDATSGIEAGKMLQLSILNFKTPPSMQQINSFQVQTTNSKGSLIDQSFANSIIYQATTQATIPSTFISITALDPKINRQTTIQIQIKNLNPIQADSSLIIIIPIEFDISGLNTLTGSGGRIKNSPTYVFTPASRQIEIKKFNQAYLEPLVNIYVNIATIRTPLSTLPTSSFSVTFIDPNGQNIESVSSGVVFNAQAGGLNTGATVTLSNKLINSMNVQYKFSFTPLNSINSGAIIRITFPDQILATNRVNSKLTSQSSQLSSNAILSVTSNKFAVITNAFSATYNPSTQGALSITINQITNPPTVTTTDTFKIEIYYTEIPYNFLTSFPTTSSTYILTVSAQPNTNLGLETILQSQDTGFNNQLQFKINTNGFQIAKGSYLRIVIPPQFEIYDYEIAGGTCLKISGFSDEVQCSFSKFTSDGHVLEVRNGFNSQLYSGTGEEVSFNISQIRNPKTSRETDTFKLSIYDGNNNLQYVYSDTQTFRMQPSPFQYAMISKNSSVTGESTIYTFTLTLAVDTFIDSNIEVRVPDDIVYDTSKPLVCQGVLNLNKSFACLNKNNKVFVLSIRSDKNNVTFISNGTSVSFNLGYFFNPISLKESNSFQVVTYETSNSNTNYYYINSETKSLTVQNTVRGNISNLVVSQFGQELNSATSLRLKFTTQNKIPQSSKIILTLPLIIQINNSASLSATLNNQSTTLSLQSASNQLTIQIPSSIVNANSFDLNITKGLINPVSGPYLYDSFIMDIQTNLGFSIDFISVSPTSSTNPEFVKQNPQYQQIQVNCTNNCSTCSLGVSKCQSCTFDSKQNLTFYLNSQNQQCNSQCDKGFYAESSNFTCKKCEFPCEECFLGSQLCTKCFANNTQPYANPQTLQCYSECPTGTYLDKAERVCKICNSPCYTCLDSLNCLSCDRVNTQNPFINYYQSKCYDKCPSGTVATPQSSICIECTSPCRTCQDSQPDFCSSCQSGYYHLKNSLCVSTCPSQYLPNTDTMKCDFQGEMVFPLPFSILTVIFALGLGIARFMKNQTRFYVTLLAFTDIVLRFNWVFLLIYLYIGDFLVSASIIAYCLLFGTLSNFVIWRLAFYRSGLDTDKEYNRYTLRFSYSRLLGKKQFSAGFQNFSSFVRLMSGMTIFNLVFICLPAVFANAYNLAYAKQSQQVFYLDLDGLILVCFECVMVGFVIKQGEKVAMGSDLFKSLVGAKSEQMSEEQQKIDEAINKMHRESLAKKHFGGHSSLYNRNNNTDLSDRSNMDDDQSEERQDNDLNLVALDYSKNIFRNLFKQFQTQTSGQTNDAKYFTQNNFAFLDIEEYRRLKQLLKSLQVQLYNIRQQSETQANKKIVIEKKLGHLGGENQKLLSEEEMLKNQYEEMKEQLRVFREITQKELEESQNMRRDQIKHKVKINKLKQFIADTVLQKGKEILQERKDKEREEQELKDRLDRLEKEKEEQKRLEAQLRKSKKPSFLEPTLSSIMKDDQQEKNLMQELKLQTQVSQTQQNFYQDTANQEQITTNVQQQKRFRQEKTMSPHRAKPPLAQKDRSNNKITGVFEYDEQSTVDKNGRRQRSTVADRGPKFIKDKSEFSNDRRGNRISVANNYTGFIAQNEMKNQRNIEVINSNAVSLNGSPEAARRFTQTQNDFRSSSRQISPLRMSSMEIIMNQQQNNNFLRDDIQNQFSRETSPNRLQTSPNPKSYSPSRNQMGIAGNQSPNKAVGIEAWINDQDEQHSLEQRQQQQLSPVRIQRLISGNNNDEYQQQLQSPQRKQLKQDHEIIELEEDSPSLDLL